MCSHNHGTVHTSNAQAASHGLLHTAGTWEKAEAEAHANYSVTRSLVTTQVAEAPCGIQEWLAGAELGDTLFLVSGVSMLSSTSPTPLEGTPLQAQGQQKQLRLREALGGKGVLTVLLLERIAEEMEVFKMVTCPCHYCTVG